MKALLVEDNAADVALFRLALETIPASIDLTVADDGVEALNLLRRAGRNARHHRPDFILLDLNLPRKDGLEVLGELKHDPDLWNIPVVVLSSSRSPEEIAQACELDAAAYFVKPLSGFDRVVHSIVKFMSPVDLPENGPAGPFVGAMFTDLAEGVLQDGGPVEARERGRVESPADVRIAMDASDALVMVDRVPRPPAPGLVSAGAALDQALGTLDPIIRESHARIVRRDMPAVRADRALLVQLFEGLVGNALKFCMGSRAWVEITARLSGGEWVFSVRDNGTGVDPTYFDRVLHLLRRLHQRESLPGAGRGLDVCERIVERLGGRMWVESTSGGGAAVFFTLPHSRSDPPRRRQPPAGPA